MKKIYLFLFVSAWFCSNAQQVSVRGLLKDSQTNESVISASIGVKNTAMGTISNEEGVFQLSVSKTSEIIISCIGYKTLTLPASGFMQEIQTIQMEQSEEVLDEVMVTKIPLHEILKDVIYTSASRLNKPILLHTYYREFSKTNGKYNRFADGLLDYHIGGTTKKTTSELTIPQNRSFNLLTPEEEEDAAGGSFINVQNAAMLNYTINYLYKRLIDDKNYEKYDFELRSKKDAAGNESYAISFEPKAAIEKPLYKGTVIYNPQTKLIVEAEIVMAPSHMKYARTINLLIARVSALDSKLKTAYKMSGNNYVLSYSALYNKIRIFNKKHSYELESKSDLIVTNFGKDDVPYDKKQRFKKKHLYEKPSNFTDKFWQESNALVLTAEEEKIISNLEKNSIAIPQ